MRKKKFGYSRETIITMDNFKGHESEELTKLCKENKIKILNFPSHSSHLCQQLYLFIFDSCNKYLNNNDSIKYIIMEQEMTHDIPENVRITYLDMITKVNNNFIVSLKHPLTNENRILNILNDWDKSSSFGNIQSAFRQARFYSISNYMSE